MIYDCNIPAVPIAYVDGEAVEFLTRELELFFELVAEVVAEEGELRDFIIKQLAELERDVNFAEAS